MLNPLKIVSKLFKSGNQKELDRIVKIVSKIKPSPKTLKNLIFAFNALQFDGVIVIVIKLCFNRFTCLCSQGF